MGTAEHMMPCGSVAQRSGFYSLSRDGDSGTWVCRPFAEPPVFLFAVARWGQRNWRTLSRPSCTRRFYSLSRDGDSGTVRVGRRHGCDSGFYSLSRDGDSGMLRQPLVDGCPRCRFYSLSRDGDSGTSRTVKVTANQGVSIRCREMGTAELSFMPATPSLTYVSIRCREMGTAEQVQQLGHADDEQVSIRCREMGTAERTAPRSA